MLLIFYIMMGFTILSIAYMQMQFSLVKVRTEKYLKYARIMNNNVKKYGANNG